MTSTSHKKFMNECKEIVIGFYEELLAIDQIVSRKEQKEEFLKLKERYINLPEETYEYINMVAVARGGNREARYFINFEDLFNKIEQRFYVFSYPNKTAVWDNLGDFVFDNKEKGNMNAKGRKRV